MILFGLCLCASFVSLDFVSASFVTSQRANINILAQTFIEEDKKEGFFFFPFQVRKYDQGDVFFGYYGVLKVNLCKIAETRKNKQKLT